MKKLIALVMGVIMLLLTATPVGAIWLDKDHWVDEELAIEFRDLNKDGIHDVAHVHEILWDGYVCHGDVPAYTMKEYIDRWYELHSI
jgi:hypothetical protein